MPTLTDSQPVSIRLENDVVEYLQMVAYCKSIAQECKVGYTDLIREAIQSTYPLDKELCKMSEIAKLCWKQVFIGYEKMKLSGATACVIDEGRHKRPARLPQQAGLPEHLDAAKKLGLHIHFHSKLISNDATSEVTYEYLILSTKATLATEEVKAVVPDSMSSD